jgi:hypothetical protein
VHRRNHRDFVAARGSAEVRVNVKKTRAVAAAFVGIALTAGVAFAANPHRDTTPVAEVQDDPAEQPEVEAPDTDTPETDGDSQGDSQGTGAQGEHGALVSAVAQDKSAVGGPNNNHGGAVSLVARGTHGTAAATKGKSKNHKPD